MTNVFKAVTLSQLREPISHPEQEATEWQRFCWAVRVNKLNAAILDQGELLCLAMASLPLLKDCRVGAPVAFTKRSATCARFYSGLCGIRSATIHTRHAFWLIGPELQNFVLPEFKSL